MKTSNLSNSILRWAGPLAVAATASAVGARAAEWNGLKDASKSLRTERYTFKGANPTGGPGNENYYDGDFADFDGDGRPDRGLGARYGLLRNVCEGWMEPYAGFTGFLFRGMPGAAGWGEDGFQWADVDNDGDYDILQGGNGEPLTLQINQEARFRLKWKQSISALNIVNTDIEGDGDVDLAIAHAFCADRSCGGPRQFALLVNDGKGNFQEEAYKRGLPFGEPWYGVTGVVSGDVDGDGDYDLLVSHGHEKDPKLRHVSVALNDSSGNYRIKATQIPPAGSGFGQGVNLGDIDGDGDLDLVMCHGPYGKAGEHSAVQHVIAVNDGQGNFTEESEQRFIGDYPGSRKQYAGENGKLVDIDYDGDLDLLAHNIRDGFFQIYQNDGSGFFRHDPDHSMSFPGVAKGLGSDVDIADLDGDGSYDVWLGGGAADVHILLNSHRDPGGERADVPRGLTARPAAGGSGIEVSWKAPSFAANVRYYKVYRSLAPRLDDGDRPLLEIIGQRHQDESFAAPVPGAVVHYTDRTAVPGIRYYYTVQHVGTENSHSGHSRESEAVLPRSQTEKDTTAPQLQIVSPTTQSWSQFPRIVVAFSDEQSGIDQSSLSISFDHAIREDTPPHRNIANQSLRLDDHSSILPLRPPYVLPVDELTTMTVRVSDRAGNATSRTTRFYVSTECKIPPLAAFTVQTQLPASQLAEFDANNSTDQDGRILRCEWYFADGTTALGPRVTKRLQGGQAPDVVLLVRDNEGGVGIAPEPSSGR